MRILTVVGARPQFVKAAAVSRILRREHREILVHTGQHYDHGLSQVFFDELEMAPPDYNLKVGSGSHGHQTGQMLVRIEDVLLQERPDAVLVYGDTNSTLAAALAAAKLHIPVAHVEAGLRSFNPAMPEEINRRLTDHLSQILFAPTAAATAQLGREGIAAGVHQVGDVMYDILQANLERSRACSRLRAALGLEAGRYVLATIHRAENTDDPERLRAILEAFSAIDLPVLWPMHPRTRARIGQFGLEPLLAAAPQLRVVEPVGYLDMLALEAQARLILTDSGGVQKEAYLLAVPCLTVRGETEWIETVSSGWNRLVAAEPAAIALAVTGCTRPAEHPAHYGDGNAARRIVEVLERHFAVAVPA
ncbi:non-hydrolyzing UDP-N-acetylglucosamine 2-epimerase [Gloeobacter kilaueensis]|uniref:UDP-N-acetylglucosamine 2-epimerase n=1 Tax=Gloeobacter kilaueensis (strain ATCC BAA-2537 / CCAP 1431/1 / ULC 316 / JS1) TaxID=1183438 RepID=U5QCT1_GLOK1|nr:UDP-N-acetylglucosamine 2-epimerase (non-hydrolyzing) [Gloeobacter kilaueensis]AGY56727.1 UDP-N-acetylglucosamine 2-epimerase [Gloeobacter kilaueensis JS1]